MKVSEITVELVKQYCRIDTSDDDALLALILPAATNFCKSYTGLSNEEMDEYEDMTLAVLAFCGEMYEVRQVTMDGIAINPTVAQILGSHSYNLI